MCSGKEIIISFQQSCTLGKLFLGPVQKLNLHIAICNNQRHTIDMEAQSNVRLNSFANLNLFLKKMPDPKGIYKHIFIGERNQVYNRRNRTQPKLCSGAPYQKYLSKQELKAKLLSITLNVLPKLKEKISSKTTVQMMQIFFL